MDIEELRRQTRGMIRVGTVCDIHAAECMARVRFDDKDGTPSPEMPVITRGSGENKDYWLPDIGEEVVCIFAMNDKNFSTGWILGTYFADKRRAQAASVDIRRTDFGDGSYIEFNRAAGSLTINCTGEVIIKGSNIRLN